MEDYLLKLEFRITETIISSIKFSQVIKLIMLFGDLNIFQNMIIRNIVMT